MRRCLAAIAIATASAKTPPEAWIVGQTASCSGFQQGVKTCHQKACPIGCDPTDCKLREWGDWSSSDCTGLCERERGVAVPNNECGTPCLGALIETKRCPTTCHKAPSDCKFGPWNPWGSCGHGVSQKTRTRNILKNAMNGGQPCVGSMNETEGCPIPVNPDCDLSDWTKWTACSVSCGDGQKTRVRQMLSATLNTHLAAAGSACQESLKETAPCSANAEGCPVDVDCLWDDWTTWSGCTCSCAGGQKTRDRRIKVSPKGNGQLCLAEDRSEIAPCNTQPCSKEVCIDGKWGEWTDYGDCTASCGGGVMMRHRKITTEANGCGVPAFGHDTEFKPCGTKSCSESIDCSFASWTPWSDCSCTCNGVKRRARRIAVYGKGNGKWCDGDLKQVEPCNTDVCKKTVDSTDCKLSEWGKWTACSATCGVGQHTRERTVIAEATNGGAACSGHLSWTKPCTEKPCPEVKGTPCLWGNWMEWGACDKCGGQRKRNRQILKMPENGGDPCSPEASEETGACPRHCHASYFCEWGEWETVGACSVSCGTGVVKAKRYLTAKKAPEVIGRSLYEDLEQSSALAEDRHFRDVALSFAVGSLFSFIAFGVVGRAWRVLSSSRDVATDEQAEALNVQ